MGIAVRLQSVANTVLGKSQARRTGREKMPSVGGQRHAYCFSLTGRLLPSG